MAKTKNDDNPKGKQVRRAIDGPEIEHDMLIGKITELNMEDRQRSSSAGETRSKVGAFIEQTGMNNKAFAVTRMILKQFDKDDGQHKAMDVIRSLEKALPMLKAHVGGQQGEMSLEPESQPEPIEPEGDDSAPYAGDDFDDPNLPPEPVAADDDFEATLAASTLAEEGEAA